jgi:hypothetical protein
VGFLNRQGRRHAGRPVETPAERAAREAGFFAYAEGPGLSGSPYLDPALAAAWWRGYLRADLLDTQVW